MLSYEEALEMILRTIRPLPAEEVDLPEALGRVLAADVAAGWDMPPADNSAMDGFAFCAAGLGPERELAIAGLSRAGAGYDREVRPGEAVKIMTGAPLPKGCDTVVPLEEVRQENGCLRLRRPVQAGDHVRCRGEEFLAGELLLRQGTLLRAGELALLASAGVARVRVGRRPRVALLTTGDELVDLGTRPGPGQIVNSNLHLITARLREEGAQVLSLGTAGDGEESLTTMLRQGLQADLLLTTGGVSMGDYDLVQDCLGQLGFRLGFWKVAIKPGKPVLFGTVGATPVFGLPGNPAAAAATFQLFALPALRRLASFPDPLPYCCRAILSAPVRGGGNRRRFLWGKVAAGSEGYVFTPTERQGSGQNRALQGVQALLPVAAGSPDLPAGTPVEIQLIYPSAAMLPL